MASGNVDLVRPLYVDWERGDWFGSGEWAHPEIELVFADGPSPGRRIGVAGMAEGLRDWLSAWNEFRVKAEKYQQLDDERVLVLVELRARGKASGLEVEQLRSEGANLFHVRDGKVTKLVVYLDRERALADLGLGPEGDASAASS